MPRLREIVMNNLGIKIASLVLALAVYAHVLSSQKRDVEVFAPIILSGLPEGLTYQGDVPNGVPVLVEAQGLEIWRLRAQAPEIRIDLSEARPGLLQRPVTTEDVALASGSGAQVKSVVKPISLSLQVENVISKTLAVLPRIVGEPDPSAVRFGDITAVPESVQVQGPESVVSPLIAIRTEEVDLSGRKETVEEEVVLVAFGELDLEVESARIRVPIVAIERRTLGPLSVSLPATLGGGWTTQPESVRVVLEGPSPILQEVSPTDIVVRAELRPPIRGEQEVVALSLNLSDDLDEHIRAVSPEPETVLLVRRTP